MSWYTSYNHIHGTNSSEGKRRQRKKDQRQCSNLGPTLYCGVSEHRCRVQANNACHEILTGIYVLSSTPHVYKCAPIHSLPFQQTGYTLPKSVEERVDTRIYYQQDAFDGYGHHKQTLDGAYRHVHGLLMTMCSPRHHAHLDLVAGNSKDFNYLGYNCPCAPYPGLAAPHLHLWEGTISVNHDQLGNTGQLPHEFRWYLDDPLWDSAVCAQPIAPVVITVVLGLLPHWTRRRVMTLQ